MKRNSKRYVDQTTQNVITLLNTVFGKLKPGSKLSVSKNRAAVESRPVCLGERCQYKTAPLRELTFID